MFASSRLSKHSCLLVLLLAITLLFCAGCGAQSNNAEQEQRTDVHPFDMLFIGTWKTIGLEHGKTEYTEDILKTLDDLDMSLVLKMKKDRTCKLEIAEQDSYKGTWETEGALRVHISLDKFGELDGEFKDNGTIEFDEKKSKLVFAKQ